MKKIIFIGLLIFSLALMGCNEDELEVYKEAKIKTDTIEIGKSKLETEVNVELAEKLPEELEKIRNFVESVTYSNDTMYDKEENNIIVRQYFGTNTIGFDTVFYSNNGNEFLKIPFLGKFIELDNLGEFDNEILSEINFEEPPISEETVKQVSDLWLQLINEEDVVNLGNEVVDTPEGEVKVKKMVVTFKDSQLKEFLNQVLDMLKYDEKFRSELLNYPGFTIDEDQKMGAVETTDVDTEEMIENLRTFIGFISFDKFVMTTYIDIDDYIVDSEYEISVSFVGIISEVIKSIKVSSSYQLYDIGEKIEFLFPEINKNNTTTLKKVLEELKLDILLNN